MASEKNKIVEYRTPDGYRAIREWSPEDQPREKMMKYGAKALSNTELIAILISSGTTGISAIDLARTLLSRHQSLSELSGANISELKKVKGIGDAKAISLIAAFELAKRTGNNPFEDKTKFTSPEDIAAYFIPRMKNEKVENFIVCLLDTSNRLFREVKVSEGTLNATIVHPREVFREAISYSAASIVVVHNHPSGNPEPSNQDKAITKQLVSAGEVIGIKVLDHLIIAGNTFTSFVQIGLI